MKLADLERVKVLAKRRIDVEVALTNLEKSRNELQLLKLSWSGSQIDCSVDTQTFIAYLKTEIALIDKELISRKVDL